MRPADDLWGLAGGYRRSALLAALADLGVPDVLVEQSSPAEEVAAAVGADAPSMARLLRAAASDGLLSVDEGRYANGPVTEQLVSGGDRDMLLGWTMLPTAYRSWLGLAEAVRSGHSPGRGFHAALAAHPEEGAAYARAMESTIESFEETLDVFDMSRFGVVVDVGGGQGTFLAGWLRRNPGGRGILVDLPEVVEGAPERLAGYGVADRVQIIAGSAFESVPSDGDAYVLSTVLRCFDDAGVVAMLTTIRRCMPADATVLVMEMPLPEEGIEAWQGLGDLTAWMVYDGADRTVAEWRRLFAQAGLDLHTVTPIDDVYAVLEARPVKDA